ncbi:MAG: hypothetical protein RLN61_00010, partial [Algiphilus sp.]
PFVPGRGDPPDSINITQPLILSGRPPPGIDNLTQHLDKGESIQVNSHTEHVLQRLAPTTVIIPTIPIILIITTLNPKPLVLS